MKKMFIIILLSCFSYAVTGQDIKVNPYNENDRQGYQVLLENKEATVSDFVSLYFKSSGKVRFRDGQYTITALSRADFPFPEITLYSQATPYHGKTKAVVWMADSLMADSNYKEKLQNLWKNFALDFYRHLVQLEIDESNQALQYAEKQFQRLDRDSLNLKNDLVKNREEKIKLEEALKTNDLNHKVLLQKIRNNKYDKDSVAVAIDKIQRLVKAQEKRKRNIN